MINIHNIEIDDETLKIIKMVKEINVKNSIWYLVSLKEYKKLKASIELIDSIDESEWRLWHDNDIAILSDIGNQITRIIDNCYININGEFVNCLDYKCMIDRK